MILNLASVVDWRAKTSEKNIQVYIDNVQENARRAMHDYAIVDLVYVETTGIYIKIDWNKQVSYRITELFTNITVQFLWVQVNERINIRRLMPHFIEKYDPLP